MTLAELLEALGAANASEVEIEHPHHASGPDPDKEAEANRQRNVTIARGEAVARCGGKSRKVIGSEAAALIKAGAKDTR
jgi:hypothetical protein